MLEDERVYHGVLSQVRTMHIDFLERLAGGLLLINILSRFRMECLVPIIYARKEVQLKALILFMFHFTFDAEDFINCRRHFRASEKRAYADFKEPLPPEERYTGRFFKHDFVFEQVKTEDGVEVEVPWYEDISTWEKLKKWLSSENKLDKPAEFLLSYNEWNPIGEELETEE